MAPLITYLLSPPTLQVLKGPWDKGSLKASFSGSIIEFYMGEEGSG